jgi:hypothetical protein
MRKVVLGLALGVVAIGASGCALYGPGNQSVYNEDLNKYVGELHAQSGGANGYLFTAYRRTNEELLTFGFSQLMLDLYNSKSGTGEQKAKQTLASLRSLTSDIEFSQWQDAIASDEWDDFRGALLDMATQSDRCIAVHFKSGENWTTRAGSDASCNPNEPPLVGATLIDGHGTAEQWLGSCVDYDSGARQIRYKGTVIHTIRRSSTSAPWRVEVIDLASTARPSGNPVSADVYTDIWRFRGSDGVDEVTLTGRYLNSGGFSSYNPANVSPWNSVDGGMRADWWRAGDAWYFYAHFVSFDFDRNGSRDCTVVMPYGYPWTEPPADRPRR